MTIFDTPLSASATSTPHRASLVDRLVGGEPYALVLGGQGADWLRPLADLLGDFALTAELDAVLSQARELLAPVAADLTRTGRTFDPLAWADVLAAAHSAEDDEAPAVVKTKFANALYEGREEQVAAEYPLKRLGEPEDIAAVVAFLLSQDAAWVTGQTLVVDGGLTLTGGSV